MEKQVRRSKGGGEGQKKNIKITVTVEQTESVSKITKRTLNYLAYRIRLCNSVCPEGH